MNLFVLLQLFVLSFIVQCYIMLSYWIFPLFTHFLEAQPPNTQVCLPACPPACLPACQFQLASGEVSLTIVTSTIVGEYRRVFYNYPGAKNEQSHTQTV